MPFSNEEKLACAEREVRQRERVYARLVAGGKMTASKADQEVALMKAIVADYHAQSAGERFSDDLDTCGKLECNREARDAIYAQRDEAHEQLDRDMGWGGHW